MNSVPHPSAPPARSTMLLETRAVVDMARMVVPLLGAQLRRRQLQDNCRVMVIPGFGSDDRWTAPLRHYLNRLGYTAEGWGLGKNLAGIDLRHSLDDLSPLWKFSPRPNYRGEASVPFLADRLADRVQQRHAEHGVPITLIGWSLGGYLAREVARDFPGIVDQVITLGSPTIGGPKYTAAAPFFIKRGMDLDWIETEIRNREVRPISQPITAIYSKSDGVVRWNAAIDHHSRDVRHIEVKTAHLGMAFCPTIWRHIVTALASTRPALDS